MNIKSGLAIAGIFIALLSTLVSLIEMKPGAGDGPAKKAEVLKLLDGIARQVLPANFLPIAAVLAPIAIDIIVAVANSSDFFKPSVAPSPAP